MKKIILFFYFLFPIFSFANSNHTLALENSDIFILLNMKCSPCDIACNNIEYTILNKKNSVKTTGKAESINIEHSNDFRGYILRNNKETYTLTESGKESLWELLIEDGNKTTSESIIKEIFNDGTC